MSTPRVVMGDEVYYRHPERGVLSGPVVSSGADGVLVRQGNDHHGVTWDRLLGHKKRRIRKLKVVERGEDGFVFEDEDGNRDYLAGEPPEAKKNGQIEIDAALIKAGYDPGEEYIAAHYGAHWRRRNEEP